LDLNTPVIELKGIGAKTCELFHKIGVENVNDLLHYYPRMYDKYENISLFSDVSIGERGAFKAKIISIPKLNRFKGKTILTFFINDGIDSIEVKFFNTPYLAKVYKINDTKIFRGILRNKSSRIYFR